MQETRKPRVYNENKVVTILGPNSKIIGEVWCRGTIRIEGLIQGSVSSDDSVVLLEGAKILGNINAGQVIISGEVEGNIRAVDRLEIKSPGKVIGDICAPRICIHEGVFFDGLCTMRPGPFVATTPQPSGQTASASA